MNDLINMLKIAAANNFTLYTNSHNFHWSINGVDFPQYHKFLNDIYTAFQSNIDAYGEKTRQLGDYFNINTYDEYAAIDLETDTVKDPEIIFETLLDDMNTAVSQIQDTYDAAGQQREYGLQNFLAERLDELRQFQWMIQSILGD